MAGQEKELYPSHVHTLRHGNGGLLLVCPGSHDTEAAPSGNGACPNLHAA